jgi:hypothetical protein
MIKPAVFVKSAIGEKIQCFAATRVLASAGVTQFLSAAMQRPVKANPVAAELAIL